MTYYYYLRMGGENDPVTGNDDVSLANETDVSEEFSDRKLGEPVAEVILRNLAHFFPTLFSLSITLSSFKQSNDSSEGLPLSFSA